MSDGSRKRSPTPKAMVETVAASAAPTPALGLSAAWPTSGGAGVELMALARLLAVLDATPRMAAAAEALGLSYRSAWGRLVDAERALGVTLVERVKGHGSRLTPRGRELLAAVRRFEGAAGASLHEPLARLGAAVAGLTAASAPLALRLAASQDLLSEEDSSILIENFDKLMALEKVLRRWSYEGESVLPDTDAPLLRVAIRCGFDGIESFMGALAKWRSAIREVYLRLAGSAREKEKASILERIDA